jgi:hypothetical protein
MRTIYVATIALALSACATQSPPPVAAPVAAAPAAEKKAPQCWSGDHSKFFNVGEKTSIASVNVECKPTSDGKAAQWMGSKH